MNGEPYRPPVWQEVLDKPRSLLFGSGHLAHWQERLIHATTNTTGQDSYRVGVLHCGDSLAERICGWISIYTAKDFPNKQGRGLGNTTNGVTFDPNDNFPQTGTLADCTGDSSRLSGQFSLWPDGLVYDAGATGVLTFPPRRIVTPQIYGDDTRPFTTIKVAYIAQSGGGSFDIETSPNGTTWTKQGATVSTSNGSTIGAITTRTVTEGVYHVRVKHVSGGRIKVIGIYTGYAKSVAGFDGFAMSMGGITPSQWTTTPLAIVTPILTDLDPALVTFHWADTPQEYIDHFDEMMAIARAGNTKRSVLWVASHSYSNPSDQAAADNDTETNRQFLLSRVDSHRIAVLDVRGVTGDWSEIVTQGWTGDGVHLDWRLYAYCYSLLEEHLPIQAVARKRFDPDTIDNLPQLFATQGKAFASMALSDITEPGIHFIANGTGMPNNDQGVVLSFGIGPEATHPFSLFAVQLATNPYSADTGWYRRTKNVTWGSWVSLGSTPDLSSYLTTATASTTYVALTGNQTIAGTKTFSSPVATPNIALGYTTTATSAGTLTLTASSNNQQFFTGTTTHTVVLPVASTMTLGQRFILENNSTGVVTVNSSGSNLVVAIVPNTSVKITCILTSGTTAASWDVEYVGFASVTGTGANVLAVSPTFTGTLNGPAITASGSIRTDDTINGYRIGGSIFLTSTFGASEAYVPRTLQVDGTINFLGRTSSFPQLRRSGTTIQVRLADDSADAPLTCSNLTASGTFSVGTYTVATLPSASANAGRFAQVTDSNSTTNGNTVAGGGSNRVPVFSNGTNWIIK